MHSRPITLIDEIQAALGCRCSGEFHYDIENIPNFKGSYALILALKQDCEIEVGQLGCLSFKAGYYGYAGSARGAGGLAARLKRHFRREKAFRWHVDYFRARADVIGVWLTTEGSECEIAAALRDLPAAGVGAPGFGASDCRRCDTHLVRIAAITPGH